MLTGATESAPPYILGSYPWVEIQFMCLTADDPDFRRNILQRRPDTVIEVK